MLSFQISITPHRRAATRFIGKVRRSLLKALAEENAARGLTQSDIARVVDVHRSVINRELRGYKDITLGRVAELAFAMGRTPEFALPKAATKAGSNIPAPVIPTTVLQPLKTSNSTVKITQHTLKPGIAA